MAFADVGDRVSAYEASALSLKVRGPFAEAPGRGGRQPRLARGPRPAGQDPGAAAAHRPVAGKEPAGGRGAWRRFERCGRSVAPGPHGAGTSHRQRHPPVCRGITRRRWCGLSLGPSGPGAGGGERAAFARSRPAADRGGAGQSRRRGLDAHGLPGAPRAAASATSRPPAHAGAPRERRGSWPVGQQPPATTWKALPSATQAGDRRRPDNLRPESRRPCSSAMSGSGFTCFAHLRVPTSRPTPWPTAWRA